LGSPFDLPSSLGLTLRNPVDRKILGLVTINPVSHRVSEKSWDRKLIIKPLTALGMTSCLKQPIAQTEPPESAFEALAEDPACVLSSKSEAFGRSIFELVGIRFSSPSLKEAKVNTN
jgi:hypothetical protein